MAASVRLARVTGLILVAGLLVVLVAGAGPSVYAADPDPATSWAGSRAGEGRERPGRQGVDVTELEAAEDAANARGVGDAGGASTDSEEPAGEPDGPEADVAPEPSQNAALPVPSYASRHGSGTADEPVVQALALGSGLILMGLGLGLAFVGLRIRRS
ncbi:hypothetical protein [Streptomyces ipomoeae]|uniref:hypothetical protein n=1 Tax=Streptomyces ipomoeae TaxID=103232 RepID=UPI001146C1EC|nr:hypothetical protein [Streptomyces ipomoeae]MDX2932436.1 hypothetical protein [Streptomyces ipomoeae]TQE27119.1 hypothetical protein SipoB123_13220 [Streptomyces ipomoeae]